jgi:hypothetical protein
MAFTLNDRIHEQSVTSGTGPFTVTGARPGKRAFSDRMAVSDTTWGTVQTVDGSKWVTGLLTYNATNQITVTSVYQSSEAADAMPSFGTEIKDIFCDLPAPRALEYISGAFSVSLTAAQKAQAYRNLNQPTSAKSANYTVTTSDRGVSFALTSTATLTLPAAVDGFWFRYRNNGTGTWTLSGVTINGYSSLTVAPGDSGVVFADGSAYYAIVGSQSGSVPVNQEFTATASQTTFTVTGGYTPGKILVFLAGALVNTASITATNGSTVVFGTPCTVGQIVRVFGYLDAKGATLTRFKYTATAGATTFSGSGADDNGRTLSYTNAAGLIVTVNGTVLPPDDYTATTGTSVVLGSALSAGDIVEILAFGVAVLTDGVSYLTSQSLSTGEKTQARTNIGAQDASTALVATGAWTAYTPTITPISGAFTSVAATGEYSLKDKTVNFHVKLNITTQGTAPTTSVDLSMPVTGARSGFQFMGRENVANGNWFIARIASATGLVFRIQGDATGNNSYPGGNGTQLEFSGSYEAA